MKERKMAWTFPGQGVQEVGMGERLFHKFLIARYLYSVMDHISDGEPVTKLSFEGPAEEQNKPNKTQIIVFSLNQISYEILKDRKEYRFPAAYFAGSSLGEYNALVAGGAIGFEDAGKVVRERQRLMYEAHEMNPGGVAVTKDLTPETLEGFKKLGLEVSLINTREQTVLGSSYADLERGAEWAKQNKIPYTPLKVGCAVHTSLMEPAAGPLAKYLETVEIRDSKVPIVANTTAKPIQKAAEIREELVRQLTKTVLMRDIFSFLDQQDLDMIVEASPKMILTKMAHKMFVGAGAVGTIIVAGIEIGSYWKRRHRRNHKRSA